MSQTARHRKPRKIVRYVCPECGQFARTEMSYMADRHLKCFYCKTPLVIVWDTDGLTAYVCEDETINEILNWGGKQVNE